jgi:hypothetical protein
MGDVHGDIEAFAACLEMAGLVDDNGDWSGGTTVLVQVRYTIIHAIKQYQILSNSAFMRAAACVHS